MKSVMEVLLGSMESPDIGLACQLAVDWSNSVFLCDSFEDGTQGRAIYVENARLLVDQMDGVISPYGGSSCLYCESCKATGRFRCDVDGSIWVKLDHCVLELEDGKTFGLQTNAQ